MKKTKRKIVVDGNEMYVDFSDVEQVIKQLEKEYNPNYRRTKKEISIFIQRLKNVWIGKSHLSFAQLIGFAIIGYGFHSFKKDFETIAEIERLYSKNYASRLLEIQKMFGYNNPNTKRRRCQIDLFLGRLKKNWKNNPHTSFAELIGQITTGRTFYRFKKDEDMIKSIESI
ncbi:hypothetical protein KJ671_02510 [Patescibacteria group bacterium]|nr:hypothetical protein [Patescibacteria group bacterium]